MSEEALWNNSFYSSSAHISQSSSANHISTLRKSVAIPHSTSSNSIAAGTLDAATERDVLNQRTSFMSASPSMKALESIMNEKPGASRPEAIVEEEEPSPQPQVASVFDKPAFSNTNYTYNQGSRVSLHRPPPDASTTTFHTAASSESVARSSNNASPERPGHRHSSSISTIGESGYSMGTPKLDPPASFYTVKRPTKDFSPQLLTVQGPRKNSESDQDTTAVEDTPVDYSSYPAQSASVTTLKETKALPQPPQESPSASPRPVKSLIPQAEVLQPPFQLERSAEPNQAPASSVRDSTTSKPSRKSGTTETGSPSRPSPMKSASSSTVPKWSSSAFGTPRSNFSPHRHHQSTDLQRPQPSPGTHKRSSTMGDISAAARPKSSEPLQKKAATDSSDPGAGASKRFSFRGLFKIKSKNHSLNKQKEEMSPSRPAKLKSKSYSTPSFSTFKKENKQEKKDKPEKKEQKNLFGGFKRKKSEANIAAIPEEEPKPVQPPAQVKSKTPQTPTTPGSMGEVDTPATNTLEPTKEANTIREVEDSDYNFEYTKNGAEDDTKDDIMVDPPQRHANENFGEELALEPTPDLKLPDFKLDENSFGSPLLKYKFNETPRSKPPQSNRSSMNPPKSEQLLGEALFPKSLNPHEIESIVSLERSRSMRSIRSNGKRSSYINYNGSDENVIVYSGEAGQSSPNTMRRSGSILKNSSSMTSMNGVVHSIDQAVADDYLPSPIEAHETEELEENPGLGLLPSLDFSQDFSQGSLNQDSENLHDFIEFSDFIDVDNLEFPASPAQPYPSLPSLGDSGEFNFSPEYEAQSAAPYSDPIEPVRVAPQEPARSSPLTEVVPPIPEKPTVEESKPFDEQPQQVDSASDHEETLEEPHINTNNENGTKPDDTQESEPSLMIVENPNANVENGSAESSAPEVTPTLGTQDDALRKSPILGTAYNLAMNEAVARESPSNVARPISMSFKGFNGPAISKQTIAKTGSHQSLNLYDSSNDSSAVGQGFGSSDDESDDDNEDIYSSEDESENDIGNGFTVKKPAQAPGLKTTGNAANRGVPSPSPKLMGLQPPTGPFYHDRIPSLSDQSAASSPRSLTSFISRIRKSPMASPKVPFKTGGVRFSSRIILYDTYNGEEYDRHPDIATCNQLTPLLAQQIREELNEVKSEMEVHQDSVCYTHFF
ncbi:hypothetical protein FT663_04524 [Candidozyma haemuli var. vulneris]|uniref:Protein BNI4 n=1 Tax=Candidozyma haemuli TaxID=45357 RepID=A0A2V1ANX2_9ASCO|nr:hypothetical protein CXQ85_001561 [[Candida] haemuloni]KAF3986480.1 hypothetical protein FT662_04547 [[Candida] haemuloni var. vulneris]KAF3987265.1 hypothetical protein FT663_04524 [[Candida] haemuloni var. vulneris]PVH19256.1 hypothetical protein CXQ85_001561 [[Candida] haemuloni]